MRRLKTARSKIKQRKPARRSRTRAASVGALPIFAHEVRTSLTGVLALGELLARSDLGARERGWATDIKTSAEHLAALATLVVDGAKAGAHSLTLQRERFSPRDLLKRLGATLQARVEAKGLAVSVKIAADLPEQLIGDPIRLRAALENLIDNAVKFTDQGTIELEAYGRVKGKRVELHCLVRDSGIGLTQAEIKRLFRPFAQASSDIARRYGGAGLGLSIVKTVAEHMGGNLTVSSTPGRGSVFDFSAVLPIAQDDG